MPTEPIRFDLPPAGFNTPTNIILAIGAIMTTLGVVLLLYFLQPPHPFAFIFVLPLPWLLLGLTILYAGLAQLLTRTTLLADADAFTILSRFLFFKRTRRFPRAIIRDITLRICSGSRSDLDLAELFLCLTSGHRKRILYRYNAAECQRLRDALHALLFPDRANADPALPPPGGYLTLTTTDAKTHIHLAPEPPTQVAAASIPLAIFFMAFCSLFFGGFIAVLLQSQADSPARSVGIAIAAFLWLVFLLVSIALAMYARRRAHEQADITIDNQQLRIDITGKSPKHYRWSAASIASIAALPSGLQVNNQPVFQLQIKLHNTGYAAPFKLFTGRDPADLRWLAAALLRALNLPTPTERRIAFLENLASPDSAQLLATIDHKLHIANLRRIPSETSLILEIPPGRLSRGIGLYIFGSLWLAVCIAVLTVALFSANTPPSASAFLLLFSLPGPLMFYLGRRLINATARLELTPQTLTIHYQAIRQKNFQYPAADITAIRAAFPDPDSNLQLQIDFADGARRHHLGLFSTDELDALASSLNLALGFTT